MNPACAICGVPMETLHGNNAMPVRAGRCCNQCDDEMVTPARLVISGVDPRAAKELGKQIYKLGVMVRAVKRAMA